MILAYLFCVSSMNLLQLFFVFIQLQENALHFRGLLVVQFDLFLPFLVYMLLSVHILQQLLLHLHYLLAVFEQNLELITLSWILLRTFCYQTLRKYFELRNLLRSVVEKLPQHIDF